MKDQQSSSTPGTTVFVTNNQGTRSCSDFIKVTKGVRINKNHIRTYYSCENGTHTLFEMGNNQTIKLPITIQEVDTLINGE